MTAYWLRYSHTNAGRVAAVREKYLENEIFSRSGNFVDGQGKLERTWKVREFENK